MSGQSCMLGLDRRREIVPRGARRMTRYEFGVDVDAIDAIDIHTHVQLDSCGCHALDEDLRVATAKYFRSSSSDPDSTAEAIAEHYRQRNMAAVVFTVDARTAMGHVANSVEEIVDLAADNNDVLIPFASVDPWQGDAVARAEHLIIDCGVRGFKFHPTMQAFEPNDRKFYPLYEVISDAGLPALFHTGQTGIGAGLPGGHRLKLRYSDPLLLDDIAADFPELTIVMAHPAVPWVDVQISIATHKTNVYIDLSGWSPKYFPPQLVKAVNGRLRYQTLFGSDYPVIDVDRWRIDFDTLDIKPDVRPMIMKDNALRVLGLAGAKSQ